MRAEQMSSFVLECSERSIAHSPEPSRSPDRRLAPKPPASCRRSRARGRAFLLLTDMDPDRDSPQKKQRTDTTVEADEERHRCR